MNTLSKSLLIFTVLVSGNAFALSTFPKGLCTLDGYLAKDARQGWFLSVNHGTNSETRFVLGHDVSISGTTEAGQFVRLQIELPNAVHSSVGAARFKKLERHLNPYRKIQSYLSDEDAQKSCGR